jgi:hypothetical protein
VFRAKAEIDGADRLETTHQQAGANQQNERKRNLCDDLRAPEDTTAATQVESLPQVGARDANRRDKPKRIPVAMDMAAVNASTRQSIRDSFNRGNVPFASATSSSILQYAASSPPAPPINASTSV